MNKLSQRTVWNNKNILRYLIHMASRRAKRKGIECTITENDLVLPEICPILNIPLRKNSGVFKDDSYSIDRVDSNKGYIPGNCKVISWKANKLKGEFTLEEIENLYKYMKNNKEDVV